MKKKIEKNMEENPNKKKEYYLIIKRFISYFINLKLMLL